MILKEGALRGFVFRRKKNCLLNRWLAACLLFLSGFYLGRLWEATAPMTSTTLRNSSSGSRSDAHARVEQLLPVDLSGTSATPENVTSRGDKSHNSCETMTLSYVLTKAARRVSNSSQITTRVIYVSGKFGPTRGFYAGDLKEHKDHIASSGFFSPADIILYSDFPDWILTDPIWQQHLSFRGNTFWWDFFRSAPSRRGAGFWFWKSALLQHHLQQLNQGDFIVFSDTDRCDFTASLGTVMMDMIERQADLAAEQLGYFEKEFSKGDTYQEICPGKYASPPEDDKSLQYNSNFIILRKTSAVEKFVREWKNTAAKYHLISDEPSVAPNSMLFRENRHDQSLLSLILKCKFEEAGKNRADTEPWRPYLYTFRLQT